MVFQKRSAGQVRMVFPDSILIRAASFFRGRMCLTLSLFRRKPPCRSGPSPFEFR